MKKLTIAIFVLFFLNCIGQLPISPINASEYFQIIQSESLHKNLSFIASDEIQGRETGSEGQKKAGQYIIDFYKKNHISFPKGVENYYQKVPANFLNTKHNENLSDSENIWAFIEGKENPNEIVVLSAHYDHIGIKNNKVHNGADDDGSGTVALMEIALALQKAKEEGHGPKRSVLILHVTGEEHGLLGSKYYAQNPLFPLKNTVANVNIDMIGRRDTLHPNTNKYIYIIGSDHISKDLYNICENVNKKYNFLTLDYKYNAKDEPSRYYYRSDHYNFAEKGIPSVFLFNGIHDDYHKPTDDVEKIEFDALTIRTKYAFSIVWEIANRKKRLKIDKINNN